MLIAYKAIKPEYSVVLNSASGESQNEKYINTVIDALNQSIGHRGES
ncbi:QacE (fragment) [Enterobacterales bacterium 8AC]